MKDLSIFKKLLACLLVFVFLSLPSYNFSLAQTKQKKQDIEKQKSQLKAQLAEVEKQIADLEKKINETRKQRSSVSKEVYLLSREIEKIYLERKAIDLSIRNLEEEISFKNKEINNLLKELKEKKRLLQEALKQLYTYDNKSWFDILLSGGSLSDVFDQIQGFYSIQEKINLFIKEVDATKTKLENEKRRYEEQKYEKEQLRKLRKMQEVSLARKKAEKKRLLAQIDRNKRNYSKKLVASKKEIAFIKQQLYKLENLGVSMTFEQAYEYAKFAGEKTGVRPAFLLGIFQVESRMGTYIGGGSWYKDMYLCYINLGKRKRAEIEKAAFFKITSELGLDPDAMPVSRKPSYGCGGAMGAAQFLPSTWLGYRDKIVALGGSKNPSPWNIKDAFFAAAIKLANDGASSRTYWGEKKAAAMYIAGSRWRRFVAQSYANQVLEWASFYQKQIDKIESGNDVALK